MWDKAMKIVAIASLCVFVLAVGVSLYLGNMREVAGYGAAAWWSVMFLVWGKKDGC